MAGSLKSVVVSPIYSRILSLFPSEIRFAFAYGSGVFQQANSIDTSKNMLDLVFIVDNPLEFHSKNLKHNRSHYSALKWGGPSFLSKIQEEFGAGVYYNTLIPFEDRLIKYGVASTNNVIADLLDWKTLYLSGRLHKPVLVLKPPNDHEALKSALKMNLHNAVHTTLLLLPESFSELEFYLKIAGLSYSGDFRMWAGEDKNKVSKIVEAQMEQFRELYSDILSAETNVHFRKESHTIEQDWNPASRLHHLNLLPKHVQLYLLRIWNRDGRNRDLEDVLKVMANDIDCELVIEDGVESIVRWSSWSQSLKGILTAGMVKSVRYSAAKVKKMVKSWSFI